MHPKAKHLGMNISLKNMLLFIKFIEFYAILLMVKKFFLIISFPVDSLSLSGNFLVSIGSILSPKSTAKVALPSTSQA